MIDWQSQANSVLLNPRIPLAEQQEVASLLQNSPPLKGHFWIATSGSRNVKWAALSKHAVLASAAAVNVLLESDAADIWVNALPPFHVGGLGIQARCHLSQARLIDGYTCKWNPQSYHRMLSEHQATLSALVPAQIYDLVNANLTSPPALRAVIVGGGALQAPLFHKAAHLGWKLLPSYGLTEASSQVATAELYGGPQDGLPPLKILDHMEVSIDPSGYIKIKSPSLLTLYALNTPKGMQFIDPKKDGWFLTEDRGELSGKHLIVKGRAANFIKIGGENVDLLGLERILEEIKLSKKCTLDMVLLPVPDPRLGHVIHLAAACQQGESENIITLFQNRVLPFEKIRRIHYVAFIPRSPAFKVLHHELLHLISQT